MWISDQYYNELVKVLSGFARNKFDFDEERFESFGSVKYKKLTKLLKDTKGNTKAQINNSIEIMASLEDGSYTKIDEVNIKDNDFKIFYEKYNLIVNHHERISRHILRVKHAVTENGKIDTRLDADEVRGKWFDVIANINLIFESLSTPIEEIATVIKNVAMGKLNTKMRLKIDNFEISGDFLNLAKTINTMVDQLANFSSEVTRVAKDVGSEGILGGQANVEGVSGTWLELTNNVNGMAQNLTAQVRNIAEVTTAVAKGDLSRSINIDTKGEFLELKNNINNMILILSSRAQANKNQNWIKDGVSLLNKRVLDNDRLVDQIETSIKELSHYVNAGMGALYIYDSNNKTLKLEGSYAYTNRADVSNSFKIGEGIVGQVAYEKRPILLSHVPDNYIIQTGTTKAKAVNVYTYPLIFKDELIAVVEVASYEKFNTVILEYMDLALTALAGSLYVSIQANATRTLLVQSKKQTETLEKQSIQLQSQNAELQDQRKSMDLQRHELEIKNTDLELAQVEVNKRAQDLENANHYKSEFLANMSHELRTPLNSMLLLSGSLSKVTKIEIAKLNKQAATIHDAGNSLLDLINDILDLSKIEAKLMTVHIEEIQISSLLLELKELFTPQSEEKNIQFDSKIDVNVLSTFSSDRTKLTQVLRNFLSNAIKFTNNNGNISIEVAPNTQDDKNLRPIAFSVVDNGIGIEEDKIALVFEAFKQADGGTSRQYGGTGLGLSISNELTALLGGRIAMKSTIGKGSTFCIYLPLKINTAVIDDSLVDHIQYEHIPSMDMKTEIGISIFDDQEKLNQQDTVILIVEDNAIFAKVILEEVHNLGYKAIVARDGNAAISMARDYMPDAIILDTLLPILNGMEVLKSLKSDVNTRHIPIKILSCSESLTIAKKPGAIDLMTKPIQECELITFITSLEDFVMDKEKRVLIIEDDEVKVKYLKALFKAKKITIKVSGNVKQGLKELLINKYDCALVDLALLDMSGLRLLELMEEKNVHLPTFIYTAKELTDAELDKIRKHSHVMVLKIATSHVRLIEDVSLFLHSLKDPLTEKKQPLLCQAMSTDLAIAGTKILMVDDDIRNIYALSSVLEGKGLDITSAQNGKEALALLKKTTNKFDVVLMDIMMPVMNGYEAIREIRKDNKIKNIPIIALTAKAQTQDKKLCIEAGANDYMSKPIDHEQLISLLKVWLTPKQLSEPQGSTFYQTTSD
jgi:signal transduction histidine kinase/CheY-like chemotaxis protein/HAMP domain-containing protein